MRLLDVNNLSVRYEDTTIVDNVSFSVDEGQWLMIVGPNGAGKSTIVGAISQGVDYNGTIHYRMSKNISRWSWRKILACWLRIILWDIPLPSVKWSGWADIPTLPAYSPRKAMTKNGSSMRHWKSLDSPLL